MPAWNRPRGGYGPGYHPGLLVAGRLSEGIDESLVGVEATPLHAHLLREDSGGYVSPASTPPAGSSGREASAPSHKHP
eukprot:scaffold516114_cov26-Prasinocladus_malaysianus.AAC.1